MKKVLAVFMALLAVTLVSCKHELKQENVRFTLTGKGEFKSDGGNSAIIKEDGFSQEELYAMVKNNVMKIYINPDNVLTENEPTSLVVNGYKEKAFDDNICGSISATYRVLFEFDDGCIKVTPNIIQIDNHYFDNPDNDFPGYVYWFCTNRTGKFQEERLQEKSSIERFIDSVVNNLLWGTKN